MRKYGLGLSNNSTAYDSNARSFLSAANPLPGWRGPSPSAIRFSAQEDELKTKIVPPPLLQEVLTSLCFWGLLFAAICLRIDKRGSLITFSIY